MFNFCIIVIFWYDCWIIIIIIAHKNVYFLNSCLQPWHCLLVFYTLPFYWLDLELNSMKSTLCLIVLSESKILKCPISGTCQSPNPPQDVEGVGLGQRAEANWGYHVTSVWPIESLGTNTLLQLNIRLLIDTIGLLMFVFWGFSLYCICLLYYYYQYISLIPWY